MIESTHSAVPWLLLLLFAPAVKQHFQDCIWCYSSDSWVSTPSKSHSGLTLFDTQSQQSFDPHSGCTNHSVKGRWKLVLLFLTWIFQEFKWHHLGHQRESKSIHSWEQLTTRKKLLMSAFRTLLFLTAGAKQVLYQLTLPSDFGNIFVSSCKESTNTWLKQ